VSFRAWGAFAALGIIWGLPYFLVKVSVQELSPVLVAFGRTALGAAVLLPIAWRRGALRFPRGLRPAILAFSLAEFVVPFCLISLGERWISSAAAGILIAMVPFWVALIQRFFGFHEPLGAMRSVGLGMGFVGVAALLGLGTISWPLGWLGVACILVAALGYAIGPLIIQRHMRSLDAVGPLATSLAVASAVLAIPALSSLPARLPSTAVLVSMVALGLVCTAVAMLLMFYLVSHAGASRAAVITYINPAVAMLLGVALLHERLGAGGVLAFVMILLGSWLATRGVPAHAAPAEA
jgi:drug/metabolite transporter (DMT)-like permease